MILISWRFFLLFTHPELVRKPTKKNLVYISQTLYLSDFGQKFCFGGNYFRSIICHTVFVVWLIGRFCVGARVCVFLLVVKLWRTHSYKYTFLGNVPK